MAAIASLSALGYWASRSGETSPSPKHTGQSRSPKLSQTHRSQTQWQKTDTDVVAGYIEDAVTYIRAESALPFIVVPDLWYTSSVSGQGFATSNYGGGARIRAAMLHKCAELGVLVLDEATVLGPCLADYIADLWQTDQRWRDNIHYTTLLGRLMGVALAKLIVGYLFPAISKGFSEENLPASGYRNRWVAGGEGTRISRQGDTVSLSALSLAEPLPTRRRSMSCQKASARKSGAATTIYGNGKMVRVEINPNGMTPSNETPSDSVGSFVVLDGINFVAA